MNERELGFRNPKSDVALVITKENETSVIFNIKNFAEISEFKSENDSKLLQLSCFLKKIDVLSKIIHISLVY